MNKYLFTIGKQTYETVHFDSALTWVNISFRVLYLSRFCGKQKDDQQSESWLDGTIPSTGKYRYGRTPIQTNPPQRACHVDFVVLLICDNRVLHV